jgi:hypothetical protein
MPLENNAKDLAIPLWRDDIDHQGSWRWSK